MASNLLVKTNQPIFTTIGTYGKSGWPSYIDADGDGFPDEWNVRYTLAAGTAAFPTHREDFQVNVTRVPAVANGDSHHHYTEYIANPENAVHGINRVGTMSVTESVGVHSLQDVPIFASGPGSDLFAGIMDNTEVFHKIAEVLDWASKSRSMEIETETESERSFIYV